MIRRWKNSIRGFGALHALFWEWVSIEHNHIIDIHSHLLPGMDDGSGDFGMTLSMIRTAYEQGVRMLLFTPHSYFLAPQKNHVREVYQQTQTRIRDIFPDLQIFLGCEVYCDAKRMETVLNNLATGVFPSMNGTNYILIEFALWIEEENICNCVDQLLAHNWLPIISHAERYVNLIGNLLLIRQLRRKGCLIQVNIYSLAESNQSANRDWARTLIVHQMVDFLGTDAHSANFRPPNITQGLAYLRNTCCDTYLKKLIFSNAWMLLIN